MDQDTDEDRPPASAFDSLSLIEEERAAAGRSLGVDPLVFHGPWGVAWLVGFGLVHLRFPPGGRPLVPMSPWVPLAALYALLAAAALLSGYLSSRAFRHVHGRSSVQGAMYGGAWFLGFAGVGVIGGRFADQLPAAEGGLLWASVSVSAVGMLHMAGGAIWRDSSMFALGVWITAINVVGLLAGPGWHSLVISVGGGGGMLAVGYLLHRRRR